MSQKSTVTVAVRCRPLLESDASTTSCVVCNNNSVTVSRSSYTFDKVFGCESSQAEVFRGCASELVDKSLSGENVTILAYGQTGSGKSYSMGTNSAGTKDHLNAGIIPRFLNNLFNGLVRSTEEAGEGSSFTTRVAFLEIYNEKLIDLLSDTQQQQEKKLVIVRQKNGAMSVRGLTERHVTGCAEALQKLQEGDSKRQTATTLMNSESSRSHAIFQVMVTRRRPLIMPGEEDQPVRFVETTSKVSLVDLAGSERLKRTGAEGMRQKEGISINYGLSVLGNVIKSLCELSSHTQGNRSNNNSPSNEMNNGNVNTVSSNKSHIPYRESQLTRLLQDSLGGNSRTLFLACLSPSSISEDETLNTLRYANRAKNIQNQIKVNVSDQSDRRLLNMRAKVVALHRALVWEKFSDSTMALQNTQQQDGTQQETALKQLMLRKDVVEFIKSVTQGLALAVSPTSFSASSSSSSSSSSFSSSSSSFSSSSSSSSSMPTSTAFATEEQEENDDEALEVVDKIMEMELAEEQYSSETTTDETALMSVEGEIFSKFALLSKLRETLKERQEKMKQIELERSELEQLLNDAMKQAKAVEEEASVAALMAKASENESIREKKIIQSKNAREQQKALQKRVLQLRKKLEINQRSLKSLKNKHNDENALEKKIEFLKLSKIKLLKKSKLRNVRHMKMQQRREKELQCLRRDKRKNGKKMTRLQVISNNQKGLLDRRGTMLKRNQLELRKTRKQVVALLKYQRRGGGGGGGRTKNGTGGGKRRSIMIRHKDIQNVLNEERNNSNRTNRQNKKHTRQVNHEEKEEEETRQREQEEKKQIAVEAKFAWIEQHVTAMARERCLREKLRNELKTKDNYVTELVSILEDQDGGGDGGDGDDDGMNDRMDEIQLNITLVEARCKAYEEELQAMLSSSKAKNTHARRRRNKKNTINGANNDTNEKQDDLTMELLLNDLPKDETTALIHMFMENNVHLQTELMRITNESQDKKLQLSDTERRMALKMKSNEQAMKAMQLKMDLMVIDHDYSISKTTKNGTSANKNKEIQEIQEIQDKKELKEVTERCAQLEAQQLRFNLSSVDQEIQLRTSCSGIMDKCTKKFDQLGTSWNEREKLLQHVENGLKERAELLLSSLEKSTVNATSQIEALHNEHTSLCTILGQHQPNKAEQKEQEARTCKEKKEYLQNQVEPMRIMVDERSFIYHEQHARVVNMCSDMNIAVPALWQEETGTNDDVGTGTVLSDELMSERMVSMTDLIKSKTKRDCQVHTLSSSVRREWSRLCNNSKETMSSFYDEEMMYCVDGRGESDENENHKSNTQAMKEMKEMMITQERSFGCDDQTINALNVLSQKVQHMSSTVQNIYSHGTTLFQEIESITQETNCENSNDNNDNDESSTGSDSNCDSNDGSDIDKSEKKENINTEIPNNGSSNSDSVLLRPTLTDVKALLRRLSTAAHQDLLFNMATRLSHIDDLLDELGPSTNEEERNIMNTVVPDNYIQFSVDWKNTIIVGAQEVQQRIQLVHQIKSIEFSLMERLKSMSKIK